MKLKISQEIVDRYPGLKLGIVVVKGLDNSKECPEASSMLNDLQQQVRQTFSKEALLGDPKIKVWHEAYITFGAKPKKYRCSVENLYNTVIDGVQLKHINTVVDIYNYISLKHMIPAGGDDIHKVDGDILLTFAAGDETFMELNSDARNAPHPGEVIYRDHKEVLCRRWNWRESNKTKMTTETKDVCLVVEGLSYFSKQEIHEIADELAGMIVKYCGGVKLTFILDKEDQECNF